MTHTPPAAGGGHGPHAQPAVEHRTWSITAYWDVDGWRKQAELLVWRCPESGNHFAHLCASSGLGTPVTVNHPRRLEIACSGQRLHQQEVEEFYHRALAQVRRRFDAHDPLVRAYFDPHSMYWDS
ncbi:hypothetical protein [Nocardia sp. NPDC047648]|uniref:hypothetical protein n=1 Tax=Nocardia sp. NPDC047648 TaxID=3155625 RepID=UPI00340C05A2